VACPQCVRVRVVSPEAVHHLRQVPGFQVLGADGEVIEGMAEPEALAQLREHRLVQDVRVRVARVAAPEPLEPWLASLVNGLMELARQPAVQVGLALLVARFTLGRTGR